MVVRSSVYRRAKYKAKNDADVIRDRYASQKENMDGQIDAQFPLLETLENAIKAEIEDGSVPSIQIPFYLDFGREAWRALRRFGTGLAEVEIVEVSSPKWVARGLSPAVLERVRSVVS